MRVHDNDRPSPSLVASAYPPSLVPDLALAGCVFYFLNADAVRAMPAGARLQVMQQLATQDLRAESESKRRRPTATTAVAGGGKFADMSSHLVAGAMAGAKAVPSLVRRVGHHGAPAVQEGETGAWLVPLLISKADAYARRYENVVCAVSHR
jgi:hypothetical protein